MARWTIVTNYGESFPVCAQHAKSCKPFGQWVVGREVTGWVDVSEIVHVEGP